jgi:hypothetical protein
VVALLGVLPCHLFHRRNSQFEGIDMTNIHTSGHSTPEAKAIDEVLRKFAGVLVSRGEIPDAIAALDLMSRLSVHAKGALMMAIKEVLA